MKRREGRNVWKGTGKKHKMEIMEKTESDRRELGVTWVKEWRKVVNRSGKDSSQRGLENKRKWYLIVINVLLFLLSLIITIITITSNIYWVFTM